MATARNTRRCTKAIILGFFLLATGVALSFDVYYNQPYLFYEGKSFQVWSRTILWAFLILWNGAGLFTVIHGLTISCPQD